MAGGYDGEIRIKTKIDNADMSSQFMQLENRMEKSAANVDNLQSKFDTFTDKIKSSQNKTVELQAKLEKLAAIRVPTDEYKKISEQMEQARQKMAAANEELNQMRELGFKDENLQSYIKNLDNASKKAWDLAAAKTKLELANGAFVDQTNTEEYQKILDKLNEQKQKTNELEDAQSKVKEEIDAEIAEQNRLNSIFQSATVTNQRLVDLLKEEKDVESQIADMKNAGLTSGYDKYDEAEGKLSKIREEIKKINSEQKKVGSGAKQIENVGKAAKKSAGMMSSLLSRLKGITLSLLIFNWITKAFNGMVDSFKTGIQNMARYSGSFNERMSTLKSSVETMKNALGTLAAPIVSMVTPALATLCDWLTKAINAMNQFIALLSGQSTWTRAKQQQVDYAKSLEKTSGVAKKAAGALAAFDDLNVLQIDSDSGGGGADSVAGMHEEVQVSDKMASKMEKLRNLVSQIKEEIGVGWKSAFEKLGIDGQIQNIRDNIASIKRSFIDIFSADSVKEAAGNFAITFAFGLGTIAASFVSIGATIAQNLTGGIKKYLDDNKEDIKDHLVQMFDIGADIMLLAASAATAFALIFFTFGSNSGQVLTANLIQMFSDAFLSVSSIAAQFADDILHLLLDPFVNNQEDISVAVQGIIDVLALFSGTVADIVGQVGDGFNSLYSNYISPFIDSFATDISDLLGAFLDFWNGSMQPVLMEWAAMFDDTYQSHLLPMIDAFMELLGVLIEYIQLFWENYLKAPLQWIIANVLPLLKPILSELGKQVKFAADVIADIITTLLKVIKGVFAIIGDLIRGDWKQMWADAKQIFKDIVNGILSIVETMANGVIDAINGMIRALNSIHVDIPDWVPGLGGKSFSINLEEIGKVSITRLATGGITAGATLAEIGEAGREAVLPLEQNTGWMDTLAEKIAERMPETGGTVDASLILDGETCGRLFLPYLQSEEVRLGIAEG